jgi:hypothetical protein
VADVDTKEVIDYAAYIERSGKLERGLFRSLRWFTPNPRDANRMACVVRRPKGENAFGQYVAVMDFDGGNFRQITTDGPDNIPFAYDPKYDTPGATEVTPKTTEPAAANDQGR